MSARPIIPGRAYAVRFSGREVTVLAAHGCAAILTVFDAFLGRASHEEAPEILLRLPLLAAARLRRP